MRGRELYISKFWEFLEQNHSLCSRLPHCINLKKITHFSLFHHSGSLSVVPRPRVSASPGDLLRRANYWAHFRLTESETLRVDPSNLCFNKPSTLKSENYWSMEQTEKNIILRGIRDQGYLDSIGAELHFLHSCPNLQSRGSIYSSVQWDYRICQ